MLGSRVVLNIDDMRHVTRGTELADQTRYVPRKLSRLMRATRLLGNSDEKLRSDWMLQALTQSKASIVFVHFLDYATQFDQVWRRIDVPVVVHCHGYDVHWDVRDVTRGGPVHPPGYTDRVRGLADNVWFIANSTFTKRQLERLGMNPRKIFLKRFGVPVSARPRSHSDAEPARVLFLGRLVDFKGPVETAEAFGKVAIGDETAVLEIAGDGPLADPLDERIRELGMQARIKRLGSVRSDHGRELRERAAVFTAHNRKGVITGQEEAFGVSLLEAMGTGLPVLTGRSGGIPDFIQHQENGLLFEPGDVDSHAEMLRELLSSPQLRESLGTAAWDTVRDRYQVEHELADMNRIFTEVMRLRSLPTVTASDSRQAA